jgi:hypothetical protein
MVVVYDNLVGLGWQAEFGTLFRQNTAKSLLTPDLK